MRGLGGLGGLGGLAEMGGNEKDRPYRSLMRKNVNICI